MEFKAYTMNELESLTDAEMDEWLKTRQIGVARYDPDARIIDLSDGAGYPYEVDLDHCKTKKDLLDWIFHLAGKTWCKGSVLTDFIHCLEWSIRERHDQSLWEFFKLNK